MLKVPANPGTPFVIKDDFYAMQGVKAYMLNFAKLAAATAVSTPDPA